MTIPPQVFADISGLPGEELILPGLRTLETGRADSAEALLILIAKGRLIKAGWTFLDGLQLQLGEVEPLLYEALGKRDPDSAYRNYNSWKRRLDRFIRSLESQARTTASSGGTSSV
ncbi:MAG: hypothetical protein ACI8UO_004197 [Verrucomicrobiales bacterium]|jgi:hypothetical protein